jgi:methionyl-tRNA formyltransferase
MKIVFFGSTNFSSLILPYLNKNFEVELTINENIFNTENILESKAEIAILAAFGKILPQEILNHFKYGILNIHPSLLPKYRGASPVQNAILNGEKETGVTVIKLDEEMDHGPILAQEKIEILPTDTTESLYQKLFPMGAKLIAQNLPDYLAGQKQLNAQDHSLASYTKMLRRDDGFIDLPELKIENWKLEIEPKVRAYFSWPGLWTKAILNTNGEQKIIKLLPGRRVQVEGKKEMQYKDFINGYPNTDKNFIDFLRKAINA